MSKSLVVLTVLALAAPGLAFAGDTQQKRATGPAIAATQMSDAEMDAVTAGAPGLTINGAGNTGASGTVLLGGSNLKGVPNPTFPPTGSLFPPTAFSGQAAQAAKLCGGC